MERIPRNTDLSLKEILAILTNGEGSPYPKCMLLNEVGAICFNGEDEKKAGEKCLQQSLTASDDKLRAIAYSFLATSRKFAKTYAPDLAAFRVRSENAELLPWIDKAVANFG